MLLQDCLVDKPSQVPVQVCHLPPARHTMRLAFQIKRVAIATLLHLATSMLRVRGDLVIGTVVDVNMMETELQDFEQGWEQWSENNMQLVDTSNDNEGKVQKLNIPAKMGPTVLVPHEFLSPCILSRNFSIGADSRLEIHFSLFVTGYDPSLMDGSGPAMGIEVEAGNKSVEVLDLSRLMPSLIPEPVWKTYRFSIQNQEAKNLTLLVTLSKGSRAGAAIAMDDIKVQWLPVLAHEVAREVEHQQQLFPEVIESPENESTGITEVPSEENNTELIGNLTTTASEAEETSGSGDSSESEGSATEGSTESEEVTSSGSGDVVGNTTMLVNETTSSSGDVVGNTTMLVNETTNTTMATTQNPVVEDETGDAANQTLSTVEATISSLTQNTTDVEGTAENVTITDLGVATDSPADENISTIDTEVSIVDVTATVAKNLTSVPDPGPSSAGPLTTESDNVTVANNNASLSTTEAPGSENATLSVTAIGGNTSTGTNVTNVDSIKTTTTTTTTTTTITTTEDLKVPTTSNPHVSAANPSAIRLEERADLGSYGYTSEVVLICFCVMFGILFLGMVGKYYQLKKNIGDYRLQQGAQQTYDNP